ncbi:MAG: DUF481 domain-containing protein [Bryobacteraceae bacterium]
MKFFSLLLIPFSLIWADQITFKNGDRVTGSIVKKDKNNLTIKGAITGVITVPWDQVVSIQSDAKLNVVLKDKTVQSTLATSGGKVELKDQNRSVAFADIVTIRNGDEEAAYEKMLHPGFGQLWSGTATVGLAGTSGNSDTSTFTTAVAAARTTNNDKTSVYFNAVKASATVNGANSNTAQAVSGGWAYNRNFTSRAFVLVNNDYQYDKFQDLDLRFSAGGGLGYSVWKKERGRLDLVGGISYEHDSFSATPTLAATTRSLPNAFWGDDFLYKLSAASSLTESFRMFDDLSASHSRFTFNLALNTKLKKWLTWNLAFSDNYLSDPVPGRKTDDLLYTTGLGIAFAH